MSERNEVPVTDPGPQMVSWLTYLDSRLADQDRRLEEHSVEVDKKLGHYDSRFDKLEDLIRSTSNDSAATREQVARNGVLAAAVAALVAYGSRFLG